MREASTARERGLMDLRAVVLFRGGPERNVPRMLGHLESALSSPLPPELLFAQANRYYSQLLSDGTLTRPQPRYCTRAREAAAKTRRVSQKLLSACDLFDKSGTWDYVLEPSPEPRNTEGPPPHPSLYDTRVQAGRSAYAANELDRAQKEFERALALNPKGPNAHFGLGYILATKAPADAIQHLRQGLEMEPDNAEALYALANSLWAVGQQGEAIRTYQRVVEIDPPRTSGLGVGARSFAILRKLETR